MKNKIRFYLGYFLKKNSQIYRKLVVGWEPAARPEEMGNSEEINPLMPTMSS